jgi:hypothetical protein
MMQELLKAMQMMGRYAEKYPVKEHEFNDIKVPAN